MKRRSTTTKTTTWSIASLLFLYSQKNW